MKKFLIQFIVLLIVIFGVLSYSTGKLPTFPSTSSPSKETQVIIKNIVIPVELADTDDKRKKGLGGRELPANTGMLFVYQKADNYNFWMKGTKIALDIIWIRGDRIVDITKNAQPPAKDQKDEDLHLPIFTPREPADKVLEVNAGFSDANLINIGDKIELKKING